MITLGIETSCDETSIAVLNDGKVVTNLISSQHFHSEFGGVVPELSSRAHLQIVTPLLKKALKQAEISLSDLNLIAVTAGPGLIGALLVGLTYAKGLSFSLNIPFSGVNHIEGHIFSGFLMDEKPEYPYLCLAVSGGHTLLLLVKSELEILKLGSTIDDAAGEAFDKVSKLLGLGYPGGPKIQKIAELGADNAFKFPVADLKTEYDFSFSGLKTAVLRHLQTYKSNLFQKDIPDIAASFQKAVSEALMKSVKKAAANFNVKSFSLVGGVSANNYIRNDFKKFCEEKNIKFVLPDFEYCGDNAAMIALRGEMIYKNGIMSDLSEKAYPRIPDGTFSDLN